MSQSNPWAVALIDRELVDRLAHRLPSSTPTAARSHQVRRDRAPLCGLL